jgi:predicted MPP superfamily phosphohydrolase
VSLLLDGIKAFGLTGFGALGYGLAEAQAFTLREVSISADLKGFGGQEFRILHLSDLHITPGQTRKINWVKSLGELKPDLTVVTGDFLAHQKAVPSVIEALDFLLDGPGMFVLGSNDYFAPVIKSPFKYFDRDREIKPLGTALPTNELISELTSAGWIDLNNKQDRVDIHGLKIHARGTDDPHIYKDNYDGVAGPFDDSVFDLGVTHAPYSRVINRFVDDGAQLILAGHTHGGQVCIPFYGALVTNCDLPSNQAKGLSYVTSNYKTAPMHVSAGVGTSPFTPVRIACRPEATLITLRAN